MDIVERIERQQNEIRPVRQSLVEEVAVLLEGAVPGYPEVDDLDTPICEFMLEELWQRFLERHLMSVHERIAEEHDAKNSWPGLIVVFVISQALRVRDE